MRRWIETQSGNERVRRARIHRKHLVNSELREVVMHSDDTAGVAAVVHCDAHNASDEDAIPVRPVETRAVTNLILADCGRRVSSTMSGLGSVSSCCSNELQQMNLLIISSASFPNASSVS
jgi:hypothetical protein